MKRILPGACLALALALSGCVGGGGRAPRPAATHVGRAPVTLAAHLVGNILVVEDPWEKGQPYRFIIDTGSSVSLVSPELARRYRADGPAHDPVRVRSAGGGFALLESVTLRRLQLGAARFDYVPVLVYDCADLSAQFGTRIDGILGFPLFRSVALTLDYPNERVILRSRLPEDGVPGTAMGFASDDRTPVIAVGLGNRTIPALVDSGSASSLDINPDRLDPVFAFGPVDGPVVSTLTGDRPSRVGRLASDLSLGPYRIRRPVATLTDQMTSLGGGILSQFTVTFDQRAGRVFFQRADGGPIAAPAVRGTGISFRKMPAYWRVVGVVPGSPAASAGVAAGDLVSKVNGEPIASWDPARYEAAIAKGPSLEYTFIEGSTETVRSLRIVDIVP
jgi:hypothetical protein